MPTLALTHFSLVNIHRVSGDDTDTRAGCPSVLLLEHLSTLKDLHFWAYLAGLLHIARFDVYRFFPWSLRVDHPVVVCIHSFSQAPKIGTLLIFLGHVLNVFRLVDPIDIFPWHWLGYWDLHFIVLCFIFSTFAISPWVYAILFMDSPVRGVGGSARHITHAHVA